jgi:hypothetical protein
MRKTTNILRKHWRCQLLLQMLGQKSEDSYSKLEITHIQEVSKTGSYRNSGTQATFTGSPKNVDYSF